MAAREPERRCVGCGAHRPKTALVRLGLRDGRVVVEQSGRGEGRGAYVCDAACLGVAVSRGALRRAFRRPIPSDPIVLNLLESVQN